MGGEIKTYSAHMRIVKRLVKNTKGTKAGFILPSHKRIKIKNKK